jgi:cell wall-associated NlpC family hydrolase
MTSTWFTEERIDALEAEATTWVGTPFAANSSAKGLGVSCHTLAGALYAAAGWGEVVIPEVPISHGRFGEDSLANPFFEAMAERFTQLPHDAEVLPGDVLGFRIGRIVHHLGVALRNGRFIHALDGIGTTVSTIEDATYRSRLTTIWRPNP